MSSKDAFFGITATAPRLSGKSSLDSTINDVFNSKSFQQGVGQSGNVLSAIGGFLDEYNLTKYGARAFGPVGMLVDAGRRSTLSSSST